MRHFHKTLIITVLVLSYCINLALSGKQLLWGLVQLITRSPSPEMKVWCIAPPQSLPPALGYLDVAVLWEHVEPSNSNMKYSLEHSISPFLETHFNIRIWAILSNNIWKVLKSNTIKLSYPIQVSSRLYQNLGGSASQGLRCACSIASRGQWGIPQALGDWLGDASDSKTQLSLVSDSY